MEQSKGAQFWTKDESWSLQVCPVDICAKTLRVIVLLTTSINLMSNLTKARVGDDGHVDGRSPATSGVLNSSTLVAWLSRC